MEKKFNTFAKIIRIKKTETFIEGDFWISQYPYKSHIFRVIDILLLAHNFL